MDEGKNSGDICRSQIVGGLWAVGWELGRRVPAFLRCGPDNGFAGHNGKGLSIQNVY